MGTESSAVACLDIDLDAIAANWHTLAARHPSGPVGGVVKADGYGLGAAQVASRLAREGCRHFFVAHPEEALPVRAAVPAAMVAVLGGLWPGRAADYAAHGLLPGLASLVEIDEWSAEARRQGRALPALLHVDTGMNRLGLPPGEVDALADDPGRLAGIEIRYVMTHLVAAEVPDDPENAAQASRFAAACARFPAAPRSLANSSGIFLGPGFASDLARPGAALYGINPTPGRANPMRGVVRLSARILQVRDIPAGAGVGYNHAWRAARPSRIATVAAGYADGYLRALSNAGTAFFDGAPAPLVGRVSMDLTTFDVTDHPAAQPGAWLELIGPHNTPDALGDRAGTNGYEILTSLGSRFSRRYRGG
ncbi:MAG TPA: alanine racemase [Acetobacteraceae bacterium]|nr:alanine racemase [Acetobacteraceae bacterium]